MANRYPVLNHALLPGARLRPLAHRDDSLFYRHTGIRAHGHADIRAHRHTSCSHSHTSIPPYGFWLRLCCAALLLLAAGPGRAGEVPTAPILRIETGMHTAMIHRISVDAAGRILATASDDKTVRIWDLADGRLLQILRPPIGEGNEGKIDAVALSPDGRTVACGGWTGVQWDRSCCIYIFDRLSGQIIRRIPGFPSLIEHLVYSPDGAYLAACLGGKNGIQLYRTTDYSQAGEDKSYGNGSLGADFSNAGGTLHLATTAYDGQVRLYRVNKDGRLHLLASQSALRGKQPCGIRFSPDGSKIAVGFNDTAAVSVLSTLNLSPLYAPTGGDNGSLSAVCWSQDGRFLYAGGKYQHGNECPVRRWDDAGRGAAVDLRGARSTILALRPLHQGGVAFGAADPAFGVLDVTGKRTLYQAPQTADCRSNGNAFALSGDGSLLQFSYTQYGRTPAHFSLPERTIDVAAVGSTSLHPPITEMEGLAVTDWKDTDHPVLNGKLLDAAVPSRSLAIAPDAQHFLLGTDFYLYFFARDGSVTWKVPAPGAAWAVNLTGDGRLAVAAFGDGTIRWYRMTDGKEILAFFPHADRKRWVTWTPSGYYDCSAGGEDLIGWHLNHGPATAADFFPTSRFRSTFYRPDVVAKVLQTLDEAEALRQANEDAHRKDQQAEIIHQLPPVVTILSPSDGAEVSEAAVTVKYSLRTPSGEPATAVKARVDGVAAEAQRDLQEVSATGEEREIKVSVPRKDCTVSIVAENRYGASEPATVHLKWKGTQGFTIQPRLYVLAVGVSQYPHPEWALGFPAKDAADFARAMQAQKGKLYQDVQVKLLTDEEATRDNIADGLDWIEKQTTQHDVAAVFLAGHGVNDGRGNYYFVTHNFDIDRMKKTGIAWSDVKTTVGDIAGKTLFFVDTCHSGNVMGDTSRRALGSDATAAINELASAENGAVVFASSSGSQVSLENAKWGNGAFTKALLDGLKGGADYSHNGRITVNMLDLFISEEVKQLTGGKQTPTTTKPATVPDFPVAFAKG